MRGKELRRGLALVLELMPAAEVPASAATPFQMFDPYAYTGAATVKATSSNVRSRAGTGYSSVGRLAVGVAVTVIGEQRGTDGSTWYQTQCTGTGGAVNVGYVSSVYIRFPVAYTKDSGFEAYPTSQGFPESYKNGLRQLHAQYPNWIFKVKNTGLDRSAVIENESVLGCNLVATDSVSSQKSAANGACNWDNNTWTGFDGSSWAAAPEDIIRYYMDPRNFLDETYVFQSLSHEYDANTQTEEGLNSLISGSFLSGTTNSTGTGGSDFSSGPGSLTGGSDSGGPGSSGSSFGSSSGSSRRPGRSSTYEDTQHGPGVSDSSNGSGAAAAPPGGSSSGGSSGGSSPSGSGEASLESPHASIEPRERNVVPTSVSLVTPGQDGSGSSNGPVSSRQSGSSSGPMALPGSDQVVDQTGMSPGGGSTGTAAPYADITMAAAGQSGVSPYVLAAMILQEQGNNGINPLISGSYSGYEGYYNSFNVEVYRSGAMSAIEMGPRFTSQSGSYGCPWNTVEKAIRGGTQNYGDNYVKAGQNTFYLKKFNVQGSNLYKHQYMSSIQGTASEAAKLFQVYTADLKETALEFHIPVFNSMSEQPCMAPTGDGSPNNKLFGLEVDGFNLTPSFNRDTQECNLIVDSSVSNTTVSVYASDSNARMDGAGNVLLQNDGNDISIAVTAKNGSVRTYTIHVVKQDGGPTQGNGGSPVHGNDSSSGGIASPGGSSGGNSGGSSGSSGPGDPGGPGSPSGSGSGPGGSNVTIVEVRSR